MPAPTVDTGAVLSFQTNWRQTRIGAIRQGELLTIHYDPQRLTICRAYHDGMPAWDIFGNVRFSPGGETSGKNLMQHIGSHGVLDPPQPVPLTVRIPADATDAEIWFQTTNMFGCSSFDSQFGSNYRFTVDQAGPAQPVTYRTGAVRSLEMVNVFSEKIRKIRRPLGGGTPPAGSQLETHMALTIWVRNVAYQKNVWVDVHVFDQDDNRISADTLTLRYSGSAGGGGDFFTLDQTIFLGSGGVPGNVWPRADARKVQYRVYYEVDGRVFTDGMLHQDSVIADGEALPAAVAAAA
jgi:uncharacterized protein DUF6209